MSHLARVVRPFLRPASRHCSTLPPWALNTTLPTAPPKAWMPNGAMKRGPKYFIDMWGSGKGVNTWVLMPGVPKENVTVKVIGNEIFYKGTEVVDLPDLRGSKHDFQREYEGSFAVDPDRFDAAKLKAEIVDGIFWLHHIPNISK